MKVSLIDYTGAAHKNPSRMAAAILLFTKATRLNMNIEQLDKFYEMSPMEMDVELKKMAKTIPSSSWEFVQYTFLFQGVTREHSPTSWCAPATPVLCPADNADSGYEWL